MAHAQVEQEENEEEKKEDRKERERGRKRVRERGGLRGGDKVGSSTLSLFIYVGIRNIFKMGKTTISDVFKNLRGKSNRCGILLDVICKFFLIISKLKE